MEWSSFAAFLRSTCEDPQYEDEVLKNLISQAERAVTNIQDIRKRYQHNDLSVGMLMWRSRLTATKEPHDKVIGLLNLLPSRPRPLVTFNYAERLEVTYSKATFAIIKATGDLDALGGIKLTRGQADDHCIFKNRQFRRRMDIPSWAVDFADMDYSLFHTPPHGMLDTPWVRARPLAAGARRLDSGELILAGQVLDQVSCWTNLQWEGPNIHASKEALERVSEILSKASVRAVESDIGAIFSARKRQKNAKVLTRASQPWKDLMFDPKLAEEFHGDYLAHGFILWERAAGLSKTFTDGYKDASGKTIGPENWYGHIETYSHTMAGASTIFATECGLVGIAPSRIQEGDTVAMLDGARLPIILCPSTDDGHFTFRGFAYVQGAVMMGASYFYLRPLVDKNKRAARIYSSLNRGLHLH